VERNDFGLIEIISRPLSGEPGGNHGEPNTVLPMSRPVFEPRTARAEIHIELLLGKLFNLRSILMF
jgi:hypothetical protein